MWKINDYGKLIDQQYMILINVFEIRDNLKDDSKEIKDLKEELNKSRKIIE